MYTIFQKAGGRVRWSLDNAPTLAVMWLLSCWAVKRPGSAVWLAINTTMSSCLNGPGPDRGWETHKREQRPSGCYKRDGGSERERESGRQQGQHDTKSIICFRANKPAAVYSRLSNLQEEKGDYLFLHSPAYRIMKWSQPSNVLPPPALHKTDGCPHGKQFYFLISVVCNWTCYGAVVFYQTGIIINVPFSFDCTDNKSKSATFTFTSIPMAWKGCFRHNK